MVHFEGLWEPLLGGTWAVFLLQTMLHRKNGRIIFCMVMTISRPKSHQNGLFTCHHPCCQAKLNPTTILQLDCWLSRFFSRGRREHAGGGGGRPQGCSAVISAAEKAPICPRNSAVSYRNDLAAASHYNSHSLLCMPGVAYVSLQKSLVKKASE